MLCHYKIVLLKKNHSLHLDRFHVSLVQQLLPSKLWPHGTSSMEADSPQNL